MGWFEVEYFCVALFCDLERSGRAIFWIAIDAVLESPKNTEFPSHWGDSKILQHLSDVATDPHSVAGVGKWNSPYIVDVRDGIEVRVDFLSGSASN
ncbi:hypothetical protein DIE15_36325 [Burkholderia sp. Bp9031]|nr:hypothetical protein DIE15_36325 [Burkholderia sp. Bp9031]